MTMKPRRDEPSPKPRDRPVTREVKLDATPEEIARALFAATKKLDPSLRLPKQTSG